MPTDTLIINGKKYVSTAKAADLAGCTPEYVSKLSRDGLVGGEQMGGRSYVDFESFFGHMQEHGGEHKELFRGNLDRDPTMRTMRISACESGDIAENPRTISGTHTSRQDSSVGVRQGTQYRKDMNNSRDGVRPANTGTFLRYVGRGVMFLLIFTGVTYGWGVARSIDTDAVFASMEEKVKILAEITSEWSLPHTFLSQEMSEAQQAAVIQSRNAFSCPVCERVREVFQ